MKSTLLKKTPYGKRGIRFIDITGKKFGRLTALKFLNINNNKRANWLFICDCGNEKIAEGKLVRKGQIKSCGCLWKESISLPPGEAALNHEYLSYKLGAKKRNHQFKLSKDEFKFLVFQNCYYCNNIPSRQSKIQTNRIVSLNGIDRINNKLGYVIENVVPCCKNCNLAKQQLSNEEFLNLIEKIYLNRVKNVTS